MKRQPQCTRSSQSPHPSIFSSTRPSARRASHIMALLSTIAAVFLIAGCGGNSIDDKVADRYNEHVDKCRAVGIVDEGKIYSCQTGNSTVCVMVDGNDVFDARARAEQAGISC